ncbi:hypothetical protein GQ600_5461 [Phytophthora cactorum]|nr:hypothetical protein GQ600_5461 [Phytophthora cactorum]
MPVGAGRGNSVILEWILNHFEGCVVSVDIVGIASGNGHLEVLQYTMEHNAGHIHNRAPIDDESELYQSIPELSVRWNGPDNYICWGGRSMFRAIEIAIWMLHDGCMKTALTNTMPTRQRPSFTPL